MYSRERSTVILQHPVKKQIHILNEITTNSPKCIASVVVIMLFCLVMSHYIRKHYTQYQLFSHIFFLFIYIYTRGKTERRIFIHIFQKISRRGKIQEKRVDAGKKTRRVHATQT